MRADRGMLLEDFAFEISVGGRSVTAVLRDGFVTEEFIRLARTDTRTDAEEGRLDELKVAMARRIVAVPAGQVFHVVG